MSNKNIFDQLRAIEAMVLEADRACRVLGKAEELKQAIIQPDQEPDDDDDREDNEP